MNSVERILQYVNKKEVEKSWELPKAKDSNWPTNGEIKAINVAYKYRDK